MNGRHLERMRWDGRISGSSYLLIGVGLTLIKMLIDDVVSERFFGRVWTPWRYLIPGELLAIQDLSRADRSYYLTLLTIMLPFAAVGLTLTIRRLRDAGAPLWLVTLFFLPLPFNVIFFVILAALPPRGKPEDAGLEELAGDESQVGEKRLSIGPGPPRGRLGAWLPEDDKRCAMVAILMTLPITVGLGVLSVKVLETYGWGLFVGLPFGMPMASVMIFGLRKPRRLGECVNVGFLWFLAAFLTLAVLAFEGIVCLVLLVPLALPVCLLGATAGYFVQLIPWTMRSPGPLLLVLACLPTVIGAEGLNPRTPPLFAVTTAVEVDAPPEQVWRHVVEFSELPPPDDWIFRTGVAYPVRGTMDGRGPGAIRHCVFSTGAFVEPIEVWDEPRLLRFSVASSPPPMKEWSPFADIHPPHLDNYLVSRRGQFRLEPLPGGRTRLEGTTWYHHTMWPAAYWKIWSDGIIRRIHMQVLRHVKRLAESETRVAEAKR